MRGTGTQSDPYIIECFDDLLQIDGGTGTYYKLGVDIDANDTPYAESGWQTVSLDCTELDGDNHTIRNIVVVNLSSGQLKSAFNITSQSGFRLFRLNLENVYLNGGMSAVFQNDNDISVEFSEVNVSVRASQTVSSFYTGSIAILSGGWYGIMVKNSCISCKLNGISSVPLIRGTALNCHLSYDMKFSELGYDNKIFATDMLTNTAVFANLECTGNSVTVYPANEVHNSYFVMPSMTGISSFNTEYSIKSVSFYDADKAPETVTFNDNLNALTTGQCKSAEYLRSIGFLAEGIA